LIAEEKDPEKRKDLEKQWLVGKIVSIAS